MTITTIQKIIKIGSSRGVTLPARDLRALGIRDGDQVKISLEPLQTQDLADDDMQQLRAEYKKLKQQYGQTLKKLASR